MVRESDGVPVTYLERDACKVGLYWRKTVLFLITAHH